MAIKVYIDAGHGGRDVGAVKYLTERDVNLVMAKACKEYLDAHGVLTKMSRTTNDKNTSINTMASEANKWGADYVISIHNNAGGGDGFEVIHSIFGGEGKTLAKNIETQVKKLGQNSRGLKTRKDVDGTDYFGMIRLTNAPAIICEGVFVDNKTDIKIADTTVEQKNFGYAYAKGILKTAGIKDKGLNKSEKPATTTTTKSTITVDGEWGCKTTKMTQKVFKLTQDGKVSNQLLSCKKYLPNCLVTSWEFKKVVVGSSPMVKAIQKLIGAKVDGHMGKNSVEKLQTFLNNNGFNCGKVDGILGSGTVKAWQKYINSKL